MIGYWTNFAKTGNPNVSIENSKKSFLISRKGANTFTTWPKYTQGTDQNIEFLTPQNIVEENYLKSYCDFWDQLGYNF